MHWRFLSPHQKMCILLLLPFKTNVELLFRGPVYPVLKITIIEGNTKHSIDSGAITPTFLELYWMENNPKPLQPVYKDVWKPTNPSGNIEAIFWVRLSAFFYDAPTKSASSFPLYKDKAPVILLCWLLHVYIVFVCIKFLNDYLSEKSSNCFLSCICSPTAGILYTFKNNSTIDIPEPFCNCVQNVIYNMN